MAEQKYRLSLLLGVASATVVSLFSRLHASQTDNLDFYGCSGRKIFRFPLPARFNVELLYNHERDSSLPEEWYTYDMVKHLEKSSRNNGFGKRIQSIMAVPGLEDEWYQTDQNALENIFYARMLNYRCLVETHKEADFIYVPYFGGHDSLRHMHKGTLARDRLPLQLSRILKRHPAWARRNGSDHFMVLGRNLWDFYRQPDNHWGSKLLLIDGIRENIWTVVSESFPGIPKVVSAPKPTSFHPVDWEQVRTWQEYVRGHKRQWLFTFVGGRRGLETAEGVVRDALFSQCENSEDCSLLDCTELEKNSEGCHNVSTVFEQYMSSSFCLHPIGDSCSRRSVLDAALAGCVPVVFADCTLQHQFMWHLGADKSDILVHIPQKDLVGPPGVTYSSWPEFGSGGAVVEDVLRGIPAAKVAEMRERLIALIPRLLYGGKMEGQGVQPPDFKDAVDYIIDGLVSHAGAAAAS